MSYWKNLGSAISVFGFTRAVIKTAEIQGIPMNILGASCNYLEINCTTASYFVSHGYEIIFDASVVRIATPAYLIADTSVTYVQFLVSDKTEVFSAAPLIWFLTLGSASYFANWQETVNKDFKTQVLTLEQNSNNYTRKDQLDKIIIAFDTYNTLYPTFLRFFLEPITVLSYIFYKYYVGFEDNINAQIERESKLAQAKAEKDMLEDQVRAVTDDGEIATKRVTEAMRRKDAAQREVQTAAERVTEAIGRKDAAEAAIESTATKIESLKGQRAIALEEASARIERMKELRAESDMMLKLETPDIAPLAAFVTEQEKALRTSLEGVLLTPSGSTITATGSVYGGSRGAVGSCSEETEDTASPLSVARAGAGAVARDRAASSSAFTPRLHHSSATELGFGSPRSSFVVVVPRIHGYGSMAEIAPPADTLGDYTRAVSELSAAQNLALKTQGSIIKATAELSDARREVSLTLKSFGEVTEKLSNVYETALGKEQSSKDASDAYATALATALEKERLSSAAKSELSNAELAELAAERAIDLAIIAFEKTSNLIIKLLAEASAYHPYIALIPGIAMMEIHFLRTLSAWNQDEKSKKVIENTLQKLIEPYREGVLNDYYDCGFGDGISVRNEQIVKALANNQCTRKPDKQCAPYDANDNFANLIQPLNNYFITTEIDYPCLDMQINGLCYEPSLNTTEV